MAKFLTRDEIYRVLQRESPEGVYPDGSPTAFYSTADMYAIADLAATGYYTLQRIYDNYFPQTADERIDDWVLATYGALFDDSVPLSVKRSRVISKIRKQSSINKWEILTLIAGFLPPGMYVQIYAPCVAQTFWQLGISMLGYDTFLAGLTPQDIGIDPADWCNFLATAHWRLGQDGLGDNTYLSPVSYNDIAQIQATAFLYTIRIFGAVSDDDLRALDLLVSNNEPARCGHIIQTNLDLNDFGLTVTVPNVDQFDLVDCITADPNSTTGFTGLTT